MSGLLRPKSLMKPLIFEARALQFRATSMFIQTESTPNPASLKFLPGRPVLGEGTTHRNPADPSGRRIAAGRTAVRGRWRWRRISGLRFHYGYQDARRVAAPEAGRARCHHGALHVRHARSIPRACRRRAAKASRPEDAETVAVIKELIETRVRPAVANDGGDITFQGFRDGVVYLNMRGACAGCPSSTATLKHGIQKLLRHFVPDVTEVRPM